MLSCTLVSKRSKPATPVEAAAVAAGVVATFGVIALSLLPTLGGLLVIGTGLLAAVSAAMSAALAGRDALSFPKGKRTPGAPHELKLPVD